MWWILFTAVDLYIGLIILDALAPAVPAEKLLGLAMAKKLVIALLVLTTLAFLAALVRRYLLKTT